MKNISHTHLNVASILWLVHTHIYTLWMMLIVKINSTDYENERHCHTKIQMNIVWSMAGVCLCGLLMHEQRTGERGENQNGQKEGKNKKKLSEEQWLRTAFEIKITIRRSISFSALQNHSIVFPPDLRTVPGVLLPPPGVPGPPVPAFFVSRLLKKLANTPSLVWPAQHIGTRDQHIAEMTEQWPVVTGTTYPTVA